MVQGGMERRIAAIIRWLERFQNSYRAGAMENALMDAECARADLEDLRLDVWARVEQPPAPQRFGIRAAWALPLTMVVIILTTASPLARTMAREAAVKQELHSREEPRASATEGGRPSLQAPKPVRRDAVPRSRARGAVTSTKGRPLPEDNADTRQAGTQMGVPASDKVFSLLQTGARALKNEDPAIKISRR